MPALVVVMAGAEIYGGITAMGTAVGFWATVAAGAEIVGGAMTIYGTATHNQDLANTGSIIGAAGAIGTGLVNTPSAPPDSGGQFYTDPTGAAPPPDTSAALGSSPAPETAATTPPTTPQAGAYDKQLNTMQGKIDAFTQNQTAFQSYNTKLMMLQGISQAYESHVNANIQAESQANYLAYQKSLTDRANANANARFNLPLSAQPLPPGMPTSGLLNTNQPGFYQPQSVKPAGVA